MTKHSDNHGSDISITDQDSGKSSVTERIGDILDNTSSGALSLAKTNWYFGEWKALTKIEIEILENHPDAGLLAALKAAGHQQLNEMDKARQYVRAARQLGCDDDIISRLLIAGVHNTLGKIAALQNNDDKTLQHFKVSVDLGGKGQQAKLARHARSVKEITRLGLLPQASRLIEGESEIAKSHKVSPKENEARIAILDSELEIISHELALAHKKQQLYYNEHETEPLLGRDGEINSEALKKLSVSQLGQDVWVLEKTAYKLNGFFVEFGATDGVLLSNTYLLETSFSWKGICAEPNPQYYDKLKNNRSCVVSDACISNKTGEKVNFILANEYGGIDGISTQGRHANKVLAYKDVGEEVTMVTISLNDFLIENNAPRDIDYLSIDTEGSEYLILEAFPFDEWNIRLITVEHNYEDQRNLINALLTQQGYLCVESQWDDWYWKKDQFK